MNARVSLGLLLASLAGLAVGVLFGSRIASVAGGEARQVPAPETSVAAHTPATPSSSPTAQAHAPERREAVLEERRAEAGEVEREPEAPSADDPVLELLALWRAGVPIDRRRMAPLLVETYLDAGRPLEALRAMQRYGPVASYRCKQVGDALQEAGDEASAVEAYEAGLALDPQDWTLAGALTKLDPNRAVEVLRSVDLDSRSGRQGLIVENLVSALEATGDLEGARRAALEGLAVDPSDGRLLDRLGRLDPLEAERRLLGLIDETGEARWTCDLADLLAEQGRNEEASGLLLRALADTSDSYRREDYINTLIHALPDRAYDYLRDSVPVGRLSQDDAERWAELADRLWSAEDQERAAEAWSRALLAQTEDLEDFVYGLRECAPDRVLPALEQRLRFGEDADVTGFLGDEYWGAGRHDEALAAWKRAGELDPDEGDWPSRVARVERGEDPLDD